MNDILICSRTQAYVDRTKSGHNKLQSKAKPKVQNNASFYKKT